jgi:hypothetical protein
VRQRPRNRFTPHVERVEGRTLLNASPLMMGPIAAASMALAQRLNHAPAAAATVHKPHVVAQHHQNRPHDPDHDGDNDRDDDGGGCGCGGGSGGGVGGLPFNCNAKGIYNFAIVTITNNTTSNLNFSILAKPCPGSFVNVSLNSGQTNWYYTHFPSAGFTPSFQVNLGGLNLYSATPNIVSGKPYPQFVFQINATMGSQYQIVQTSPGVFALKPG